MENKTIKFEIDVPEHVSEKIVEDIVKEKVTSMLKVKSEYNKQILDVMREIVVDEASQYEDAIREKVKTFISNMEGSTLYFRDRFRNMVVDSVSKRHLRKKLERL